MGERRYWAVYQLWITAEFEDESLSKLPGVTEVEFADAGYEEED